MVRKLKRRGAACLRVWLIAFASVTGAVQAASEVVPGEKLPQEVLDKIIKRYDAPYITFDAEIATFISTRPGFILIPEKQIAPGTVFKVFMSRRGDLRYDLFVRGELHFTHQVAVKDVLSNDGSQPSQRFLVTEIDHIGKVIDSASMNTLLETYAEARLANHVHDYATVCSSGGYVITFLGPEGDIVTDEVEDLKTGYVVSGPSTDGRSLYRVKTIRRPQTDVEAGLYLFITVDGKKGIIMEKEFQVHHPGKAPQTFRLKRFRNIRFPKVLKNAYDIFENIPKAARSYQRWEEKATEDRIDEEGDKK